VIDKDGNEIKAGDRFIYQFGEPHQMIGKVFDCDGAQVIIWEDGDVTLVKDFYFEPTDRDVLQLF